MTDQQEDKISWQKRRARLRWAVYECFDSGELAMLLYDLGVKDEDIKGETFSEKTGHAIDYFERRSRLDDLIEMCRYLRPGYPWDQVDEPDTSGTETAEWQRRKQREATVNDSLRSERLPAYKALWSYLEPLAKYARPRPFTIAEAAKLSEAMRHWYFQEGGIYLSERCRQTYFALQEALQAVLKVKEFKDNPDQEIVGRRFEFIRKKSSSLRATMAEDLGTRR